MPEAAKTVVSAVGAWFVVNLPVMALFPRGWSEFFRLNSRRGDDMDSLYNVVKSHKPKGGSTQAGWERVANDMNDAADARRRGSTRRQTPTTAGCVGPISRTPRATRRWEMTLRWTS